MSIAAFGGSAAMGPQFFQGGHYFMLQEKPSKLNKE